MADLIEARFGVRPAMKKSGGGAYEIRAGGELIFSKLQTGRFPEDEEILEALDRRLSRS